MRYVTRTKDVVLAVSMGFRSHQDGDLERDQPRVKGLLSHDQPTFNRVSLFLATNLETKSWVRYPVSGGTQGLRSPEWEVNPGSLR